MNTEVLKLDSASAFEQSVSVAADALARGAVLGIVTDTVYGLVADRDRPEAASRLVALKERPPDKPFTVLIADAADLDRFQVNIPPAAEKLARVYWPGALTIVLENRGEGTTGFRVPAHAGTREVLRRARVAAAAPSANPAGHPPALTAREVLDYFDGRIEYVLDGGTAAGQIASTVVAVSESGCEVLREGAIPAREIRDTLNTCVLFVCTGNTCRSPLAEGLMTTALAGGLGVAPEALAENGFTVESCGVAAWESMPASEYSEKVAASYGADLSAHRARQMTPALLRRADHIFVMSRSHMSAVREAAPEAADRVRYFDPAGDVPDPIGGPLAEYRRIGARMWQIIQPLAEEFIRK